MSNTGISFPFLEPALVANVEVSKSRGKLTPVIGVWCFAGLPTLQECGIVPIEWLAANEKTSPAPHCELNQSTYIFLWPDGAMAFFEYHKMSGLWTNLYGGRITNPTCFAQKYGPWTYQVRSLPFSVIDLHENFRTTPHI